MTPPIQPKARANRNVPTFFLNPESWIILGTFRLLGGRKRPFVLFTSRCVSIMSSAPTYPSHLTAHPPTHVTTHPINPSTVASPHASSSTTNSSTPTAPKNTAPITATTKKKIRDHCVASNWPLNKNVQRGEENLESELREILTQYSLNKTHLAR